MTKKTPRGRTPSLIGSGSGRPKKTEVLRKSSCYRCKIELLKGQFCMEIPKLGGAYSNPRRVCFDCHKKILEKTEEDLMELKKIHANAVTEN